MKHVMFAVLFLIVWVTFECWLISKRWKIKSPPRCDDGKDRDFKKDSDEFFLWSADLVKDLNTFVKKINR